MAITFAIRPDMAQTTSSAVPVLAKAGVLTEGQPPKASGRKAFSHARSSAGSGMPVSGSLTEWRAAGPRIASKKQEIQQLLVVLRGPQASKQLGWKASTAAINWPFKQGSRTDFVVSDRHEQPVELSPV
mmetsp:Transcript_123752/g.240788  ORF Transcript_123752/g.240788 Transcript_123752/m.240788 type:complete len:129 (+) Transcript_123752:82-468(+)